MAAPVDRLSRILRDGAAGRDLRHHLCPADGRGGAEGEYRGLLATLDGKPVGLAHYLFHRSCWTVGNVCYLQDLFADPGVRGSGIGRALIEGVYAKAREAGSPEVYWMTQEFNATARQLYDRIAEKTPFIIYQKSF